MHLFSSTKLLVHYAISVLFLILLQEEFITGIVNLYQTTERMPLLPTFLSSNDLQPERIKD